MSIAIAECKRNRRVLIKSSDVHNRKHTDMKTIRLKIKSHVINFFFKKIRFIYTIIMYDKCMYVIFLYFSTRFKSYFLKRRTLLKVLDI